MRTSIRQLLCRHEYVRKGHNVKRTATYWLCRKCGKEITVESPLHGYPEAVCSVCGRKLDRFEESCPRAPLLADRAAGGQAPVFSLGLPAQNPLQELYNSSILYVEL